MKPRLYLEMHITIESTRCPITFEELREWAGEEWKVSKFDEDDVDGFTGKWFMSARDECCLAGAQREMRRALTELRHFGITVLRYKIEDTLLDSKHGDTL
jgi:hypothetical protein